MKKRYSSLDGLRAFAALGIVAMHVMTNGGYQLPTILSKVIGSMGEFVYLFMALSGFSMCCGYYERILDGKISISDFYKRRFQKIFPFFAMLSCLDLVINPTISSLCETFANLTLCFGLLPNPSMSVVGVGWFIGLVFVFYLVFPFFCYLLENRKRAWMAFGIALLFNFACSTYFFNDLHVVNGFDCRTNILYCSPFFMLGGLLYLYREKLEGFASQLYLVLSIGAFAGCCLVVNGTAKILALLCVSCCLIVIGISPNRNALLSNKVTAFIGGLSFELYLSHMMFFRAIEKVDLIAILGRSPIGYVLVLTLVVLFALLFAYLITKCLRQIRFA